MKNKGKQEIIINFNVTVYFYIRIIYCDKYYYVDYIKILF